jgi:tetratricopeptide (TPR) repeat protein
MSKKLKRTIIILGGVLILGVVLFLPPIWSHIGWRLENLVGIVQRWLNPPEKAMFVPSGGGSATLDPMVFTELPTSTPEVLATPTVTPTLLPAMVQLDGVKFVHQHERWNYCAPANLSMALSYWGAWATRETIARAVKPFDEDKNVMPNELRDYVNENTGTTNLQALVRMGGNLQILKNLLANHFIVLVEKGVFFTDTLTGKLAWMGHYNVVVGYDDSAQQVITMDSYIGTVENPGLGINLRIPYTEFMDQWRDFNFTFLVVYPREKQNDVLNAMGALADETNAYKEAARIAEEETKTLTGLELFMAWFNLGTSRVRLFDYMGAADAYDYAYRFIYPELPEGQRPWRMLWYQTGPYFAYYNTGRYPDVITLANNAIASSARPYLEESYYWLAKAELALGDRSAAIDNLLISFKYHPGFPPTVQELQQLGIPLP